MNLPHLRQVILSRPYYDLELQKLKVEFDKVGVELIFDPEILAKEESRYWRGHKEDV